MAAKMLVTALALLTVQSGPCSSADYSSCGESTTVVALPAATDGGTATDGGGETLGCEALCAPTNNGKSFVGCAVSTPDGGAPVVTCRDQLLCGA